MNNTRERFDEKFGDVFDVLDMSAKPINEKLWSFIETELSNARREERERMKKECTRIIAQESLNSGKYFDSDGVVPKTTIISIHDSISQL